MSQGDIVGHYLAGRYVTHQPDGVHVEARCTCGVKLEGIGVDEGAALDALWVKFKTHNLRNGSWKSTSGWTSWLRCGHTTLEMTRRYTQMVDDDDDDHDDDWVEAHRNHGPVDSFLK